jgi:hypothetical protein
MGRAIPRPSRPRHLERGCELSRLQTQLVAAAYELVVPVLRRPLPPPQPAPGPTPGPGQPPRFALGG